MATLPPGAVALWTFKNIEGVLAPDSVDSHQGIVIGATETLGDGLAFDGADDFVSVPDSSDWNFGSGDFSIDLWANFAAPPGGELGHPGDVFISQDEGAGIQNKWFLSAYSGSIDFHVNSPSLGPQFFAISPFNPTPGDWYNIALTRSGSQYTMYVNGEVVGSATESFPIPDVNAPLTIGQSDEAFGGYFDGDLQQVAIFNRALSPAEVEQVYEAGPGGDDPLIPPADFELSTDQAGDTGPFTLSISSTEAVLKAGATVTLSLLGHPDIVSTGTTVNATGTGLNAAFGFTGETDGSYTVTITNPDGSTYTVGTPLQLEPVSAPKLWMEIIGSTGIRPNDPQSYAIVYGNRGNVDASSADILFTTNSDISVTLQQGGTILPVAGGSNGSGNTLVLEIPGLDVPAGSVNVLPLTLDTTGAETEIPLGGTIESTMAGSYSLLPGPILPDPPAPTDTTSATSTTESVIDTYLSLAQDTYNVGTDNPLAGTDEAPPIDGFSAIDGSEGTDGFGVAVYANSDESQIVISFRGTDLSEDFSTTLNNVFADGSWLAGNPTVTFHDYINQALFWLNSELAMHPTAHITLTGHSLGGAIAQLLGELTGYDAIAFDAPGAAQFLQSVVYDARRFRTECKLYISVRHSL